MKTKELEKFKDKLLEKRRELIENVQKNQNYGREINRDKDTLDIADQASNAYTREFMFTMSNNDRRSLQLVANALQRIETGTYGECIACEEPIERKRLEAIPWARLCVRCQELEEQGLLQVD